MKSLRDAMRRHAGWIWHKKAEAATFRLFLNEETITELLLFNLARQFSSGKIKVQPFTKAEEAKNGADWEFWFIEGADHFGLRVQAKRLYPSGCYDSLKPNGSQTGKLIANAGNCRPVFALYNDANKFLSNLPSCGCSDYRGPSFLGCIVVPASIVQSLGSNDHKILAPKTVPLHCLFCDQSGSSGGATIPRVIAKNYDRHFGRGDGTKSADIALDQRILALANIDSDKHSEPQWLEAYLEERKLAGMTLISARDEIME